MEWTLSGDDMPIKGMKASHVGETRVHKSKICLPNFNNLFVQLNQDEFIRYNSSNDLKIQEKIT